ncbi:MAG: hypothetical protein L3J93_00050 [Thermoplasmata archaeon]|nr:hypothetical protein [Thermoplasmata archaeon]
MRHEESGLSGRDATEQGTRVGTRGRAEVLRPRADRRPGWAGRIAVTVFLTISIGLTAGTALGFVTWGPGPHLNLSRSSFSVHQTTPSNFPNTPSLTVTTAAAGLSNVNGSTYTSPATAGSYCALVDGSAGGKCPASAFALEFTLPRNGTSVQPGNDYFNVSLTYTNGTRGNTVNAVIDVTVIEGKPITAGLSDVFYLVWGVQPIEIDNLVLNVAGE